MIKRLSIVIWWGGAFACVILIGIGFFEAGRAFYGCSYKNNAQYGIKSTYQDIKKTNNITKKETKDIINVANKKSADNSDGLGVDDIVASYKAASAAGAANKAADSSQDANRIDSIVDSFNAGKKSQSTSEIAAKPKPICDLFRYSDLIAFLLGPIVMLTAACISFILGGSFFRPAKLNQ